MYVVTTLQINQTRNESLEPHYPHMSDVMCSLLVLRLDDTMVPVSPMSPGHSTSGHTVTNVIVINIGYCQNCLG